MDTWRSASQGSFHSEEGEIRLRHRLIRFLICKVTAMGTMASTSTIRCMKVQALTVPHSVMSPCVRVSLYQWVDWSSLSAWGWRFGVLGRDTFLAFVFVSGCRLQLGLVTTTPAKCVVLCTLICISYEVDNFVGTCLHSTNSLLQARRVYLLRWKKYPVAPRSMGFGRARCATQHCVPRSQA